MLKLNVALMVKRIEWRFGVTETTKIKSDATVEIIQTKIHGINSNSSMNSVFGPISYGWPFGNCQLDYEENVNIFSDVSMIIPI